MMKIREKRPSLEPCEESGWVAFDYVFDAPISREWILGLQCLGSFVYLQSLKRPFFKIESRYFVIKGLQDDSFVRVAVHREHLDCLLDVERRL